MKRYNSYGVQMSGGRSWASPWGQAVVLFIIATSSGHWMLEKLPHNIQRDIVTVYQGREEVARADAKANRKQLTLKENKRLIQILSDK